MNTDTSKINSLKEGMISHLTEYLNLEDTNSFYNYSTNYLSGPITGNTQTGNPINQKWRDAHEYTQQLTGRKMELFRLSKMLYKSNPRNRLVWQTEGGTWKDLTEGQDEAGLLNPLSEKVVPDIRIIINSSKSIDDVDSAIGLVQEILDQDENAEEDLVGPVKDLAKLAYKSNLDFSVRTLDKIDSDHYGGDMFDLGEDTPTQADQVALREIFEIDDNNNFNMVFVDSLAVNVNEGEDMDIDIDMPTPPKDRYKEKVAYDFPEKGHNQQTGEVYFYQDR